MTKIFVKIYAWFRGLFDKKKPIKDEKLEEFFIESDMKEFSDKINSFEYKSDAIGGLIDVTRSPEHFFDETITVGRDCDDWARMWSYWGNYHGYRAFEYILVNPSAVFSTAHIITVLKNGTEIILCNYRPIKSGFKTVEEAVEYMKEAWPTKYEKLCYVKYKEFEAA